MASTYDLVVIGSGPAGLASAAGTASLGARVALVERDKPADKNLYRGCLPTKILERRTARVASGVYVLLTAVCIIPGTAVYTFAQGSLLSARQSVTRTFVYPVVRRVFFVLPARGWIHTRNQLGSEE